MTVEESRKAVEWVIGNYLDRPGIHMEPSPPSRRKAREIVDQLSWHGFVVTAKCPGNDCDKCDYCLAARYRDLCE